jgi:hypothetical protein
MRKLTLDPDALDVQSFDPLPQAALQRGTVHGHGTDQPDCTNIGTQCPTWCDAADTCRFTDLGNTCVATCGTCAFSDPAQTCGATCNDPACNQPE